MRLNLYDKDLNRISIIGNRFVSCLWSEGYNSVQNFTVELQDVPEYRKKVRENYYVGRDDRRTLMVIKTVQVKDGKIIASGKQATRRLDDAAFVGTIASGKMIDKSIKDAYESSNKLSLIEFAESNLQITYGRQISNKSILTLCTTMCQSEDVGFKAVKEEQHIGIVFYKPEYNPNLVFSQRFGNLNMQSVTFSTENFKNYAIVLGQGEDSDRVRVDVDQTGGGERFEMIVDARDIVQEENESEAAYKLRLEARGYEKLLERQKTIACAFNPISKDFGIKYDLGDILTIYLPDFGIRLQARAVRFTQKSQNNKISTTVEVGTITVLR